MFREPNQSEEMIESERRMEGRDGTANSVLVIAKRKMA